MSRLRGRFFSILAVSCLLAFNAGWAHAALPELPQVFLDTTYAPALGNTITVNAGGNLQSAINVALPGDTIVLQAGATFTGTFTLPDKGASTQWIYIRSSAYASLPAPGDRVSPANVVNMATIAGTGTPVVALQSLASAHHYRFVGIEFKPAPGQFSSGLIRLGTASETSVAELPHDIVFDRCYIHGDPTLGGRRGIALNSTSTAVIDSYLSDWKENGSDAQAILGWNGPGPFKIVNNYLEGAAENVMFGGGADPSIANLVPSDIEIRGNYFFKPVAWRSQSWTVKNLLELKNSRRTLVEGNIFENTWAAAQDFAINVKATNQYGAATWARTEDFTFRNNIIRHASNAIKFCGVGCDGITTGQGRRYLVQNNLFYDINSIAWGGAGTFLQTSNITPDLVVNHNTVIHNGGTFTGGQGGEGSNIGFQFTNNIVQKGPYGFKGSGAGEGLGTLNTFFPGYFFAKNAIAGATASTYPANNFFPAAFANVGFVNFAGGDYRLAAASPYKNAGTDGKDVGANIDSVNAATVCAFDGQCGIEVSPPADTVPPLISAVAGSAVDATSATVGWTSSEPADTQMEYGTTTTYGSSTVLNTALVVPHLQSLSGLAPSTLYHFRVKSRDAAGNLATSGDFTFATPAPPDVTPPVISGVASSGITSASAAISWATNEAADSLVEYGVTAAYGSTTTLNAAQVTSHNQGLSGLSASTLYHYRVKSRDAAGNLATSGDFTFTTTAIADITPPAISAVASSAVTGSGATIGWSTNELADSQVEYGPTAAYGSTTALNPALFTAHSQNLGGLATSTVYHFRVKSRDAAGNLATSGDFTFTTLAPPPPDITPPVISTGGVSTLTSTGAAIDWLTDEPADSQVEFGLTSAYGSATALNVAMATSHSQNLGGLTPATLYHYRVKSRDAAGNLATSGDFTFTTLAAAPADIQPPGISAVAISGITFSGASISWLTNEPADSQVEYGLSTVYGSSTSLSATRLTSHALGLGGLAPSTVYHFRVRSRDAAGNLAVSGDFTFTTLASPSAVGGTTDNYTDLWWNPAESGWGVNLNHQGNIVFATLFTYDVDGTGMWLVMSDGRRQTDGSYLGTLYRTSGPVFNTEPWSPISYQAVGTMQLTFSGASNALLAYSVNGVQVTKNITRQVFDRPPVCGWATYDRSSARNFQDLWWNPAESGWGINLAHQGDILFATLFTYAAGGKDMWLVMSAGRKQANGTYTGELYRTTGPAFNSQPWSPIAYEQVGTMTLGFSSGNAATLSYTVNGVAVSKSIVRQVFSSPMTECTPAN